MKNVIPLVALSIATFMCGCAKSKMETKSPEVAVVFDGTSTLAEGIPCTTSLLKPLRVSPLLGRDFIPEDFREASPAAAILGADFWRSALASRPDVIGRELRIGDQNFVVVGIAPDSPAVLAGSKVWFATRI